MNIAFIFFPGRNLLKINTIKLIKISLLKSPQTQPRSVYISTSTGEFFKFSREGQELWKRSFSHYVFANPVYYGHIYTLRDDCTFLALDADTGRTLWQQKAAYGSGPDTLTVIAGGGVVMSSCFDKNGATALGGSTMVVAVNATDGGMLWSFRADRFMYNWMGSIQHDSVLFSDAWGGAYRLNLADGSVLWKVPPPSVPTFTIQGVPGGFTTGGLASGLNGVVYVTSNQEEIENFKSGLVLAGSTLAGCPV